MSGLRRVAVLVRRELILLARDPWSLLVTVLMPLIIIAFLKPSLRLSLVAEGYTRANGAEQTVPGMAVLFAFFLVGSIGVSFIREHVWNAWDRLRVSPATKLEILSAKAVPGLLQLTLQLGVLFGAGVLLFGLRIRGSIVALALVGFAFGTTLVALGFVFIGVSRTLGQLNTLSLVGAMVLGGLGGTLTPPSLMPSWARAVAPATPGFWAMRGFRTVILDGGGVSAALGSIMMLVAYTTALLLVGLFVLDLDRPKRL